MNGILSVQVIYKEVNQILGGFMTILKNVSFSNVITNMIMQPLHANTQGNVHGGELMKIMDNVAGIVAMKHAKPNVVTARVDELVFLKPVNVGDLITCVGQLAYVGNTSMQIIVKIYVRNLENCSEPELALSSFFTMVHLKDGKSAPVPKLIPKTDEEKKLFELGEKKYYEIKKKYHK